MRKVVMMSGTSGGDTLGGIFRSLAPAFQHLGYEFVEVNLSDPRTGLDMLEAVARSQDVAFVIGLMGMGATLGGQDATGKPINLWEALRAPYLGLYGDSPAYFFDRHVASSPNFACLYAFPEHAILRNRLPKINGMVGNTRAFTLNPLNRDELDFKQKAEGQVIFLKNCNDPEELRRNWTAWMPARPLAALREIASYLTADLADGAANQIDDVVTAYFQARGVDISCLVKMRLFFIAQLDDYIRRVKSTMMGRALMDLPVQIRGVGWDHLDFSGKRVTYVKDYDYQFSRGLIRDSLGMIDMSPNTGLGPHDRVCRAYGAYTLCLTNEQAFFRRESPHCEDFSFRLEPEAIQATVADVIAHPARSVDLGIEVAEAFRQVYTPEAAIGHWIDIAGLIRLNQWPSRPPGMAGHFLWPPDSLASALQA